LALGLVSVSPHAGHLERTRARIRLGSFASREGYALAETFVVDGRPVRDEATFAAMRRLVTRHDGLALLVDGDVPAAPARAALRGLFAAVVPLPAPDRPVTARTQAGTASGAAASQTRSKLAR
jgi:hypothetical protein